MSNKIAIISILTGNAAFHDEIEAGGVGFRSLYDVNGNKVGAYELALRENAIIKIGPLT